MLVRVFFSTIYYIIVSFFVVEHLFRFHRIVRRSIAVCVVGTGSNIGSSCFLFYYCCSFCVSNKWVRYFYSTINCFRVLLQIHGSHVHTFGHTIRSKNIFQIWSSFSENEQRNKWELVDCETGIRNSQLLDKIDGSWAGK